LLEQQSAARVLRAARFQSGMTWHVRCTRPALMSAPVQRSSPGGHVVIEAVDVVFGQGQRRTEAVRELSLRVRPGEFVSLIGPSGCGKSTLLNVIAGFTAPSAGRVELDGAPVRGPGPQRGVVFQQYALFPWLTVLGNVEFGLRALGLVRERRREIALGLLERSGLADFAQHYPEQLSGGMRQRVGIARALATDPAVLLLDEPFGALDAQTREVMQEILLDSWQRSRPSVLFVTHDIEEAVFLSDRVYVMSARPGRVRAELVIGLERPRRRELLEHEQGLVWVRRLRALVRKEIRHGSAAVEALGTV
jgi:NitT/TauT family transport system ATP-binding protein